MKRKILPILLVLALLVTSIPFRVSAAVTAEGSAGGDTRWKLYSDGHLQVSGNGPLPSKGFSLYGDNKGYWSQYADRIKTVTIESGITFIGKEIFAYCKNLTTVTMADTVTEISENAFYKSEMLSEITLSQGLLTIGKYAFYKTGLTSVQIPDSVTTIGEWAFSETPLTEITVPASVTAMGKYVFYKCKALTSATFLNTLPWLSEEIFRYCSALETVEFKAGLTGSMGNYAFAECTSLKTFTVPEGVEGIGSNTFADCTALEAISLPDTLTYIGHSAFAKTAITELTIPAAVTKVESAIVSSCEKLVSLTIPSSAFNDALYYFGGSENLKYVHIIGDKPKHDRRYFNSHADDFVVYYDAGTSGWTGHSWVDYPILPWGFTGDTVTGTCGEKVSWTLKNGVLTISGNGPIENDGQESPFEVYDKQIHTVIIEAGVTAIGENAFFRLENLRSVTIPATVKTIGIFAFMDCTGLEEVQMAEGTEEILLWAFNGCTSLKTFHMPDTVTDADGSIFTGCTALESVHLSDALTSIPQGIFTHCSALTTFNIPKAATSIGGGAFTGCRSLTEFTIPEQITALGYGAFCQTGISELFIPAWLGSVDGSMVFSDSPNLRTLHFLGDAPHNVYFADMTVTIYYPANNDSWKDFSFEDYGGTVTWVACDTLHNIVETEIPPTCTEDGTTTLGCACGYGAETYITYALGHSYENHVCLLCGEAEPTLLGDVDGNGFLSYNDALKVLRYSINLEKLENPALGDMDGNGIVNYNDALIILRKSINLA